MTDEESFNQFIEETYYNALEDLASSMLCSFSVPLKDEKSVENLGKNLEENFENAKKVLNEDDPLFDYVLEQVHDYGVSKVFDEKIIRKSLEKGFYPMAKDSKQIPFDVVHDMFSEIVDFEKINLQPIPNEILIVRYHDKKLLITLDKLHITKKLNGWLKGKFADYTISFNKNFDLCLEKLIEAYPETWILPELAENFRKIHHNPDGKISMDSVEIWHNGELVAGEIGFITKTAYASLSGFHTEDDIGTVQMCLLGKYLKDHGFSYWDLGMEMDYKYRYGAVSYNRQNQEKFYNAMENKKLEFEKIERRLGDFAK